MIPTVEDLKSSPMVHRYGDLFNPPGLTNFLGTVQVGLDLTAIRCLTFPPFACADAMTAVLYLNGRLFQSTGAAITFTWLPDRVEREATHDGLHVKTITAMAVGRMAVVVRIQVENRSGGAREVSLKLALQGGVAKSVTPWTSPTAPAETDNAIELDAQRRAVVYSSRKGDAHCFHGIDPHAGPGSTGQLQASFTLRPGETKAVSYVSAVGATRDEAARAFDALIRNVGAEIDRARDEWNDELRAAFTPGNDRYSGFLPTLHTSDKDILRVYHTGVLGVIYFKRDTPFSAYGRTYATLMPRYWHTATFLWDYSLSSLVHALLDPAVMRKMLELWMRTDIHKHFGTELLTGAGIGPWYSVNDFAMTKTAHDYLRFTGDRAWLDANVTSTAGALKRIGEYLETYATKNWRRFQTKSGLADYGGLDNLLECVSSYLHEVASLNAANVWNMRTAADVLELRGGDGARDKAAALRAGAAALAAEVQKLYARGQGWWHARFPDGSMREVRHVYDFLTVLNTIPDDLDAQQRAEMVAFFRRELQTPTWLHALSCEDPDAVFSVRPDHQWTGAYPAWPPLCVTGLYRIGEIDLAFDWLKGLSRSANQGPYAQAHFAESVVPPEAGGAIKAPSDLPYITDWTCSSNGAWVNCVIESIFGVRAGLDGRIDAVPQFGRFDPDARLENLAYQGKRYHVTRKGIAPAG